jgi:nitrite reductase/ring-hydroxylating ferredoxin subunit
MRHEVQVRLLKQLEVRLDAGTNVDAGGLMKNPTSVYVDPKLAEQEWEEIFQGQPQMIGLSGDLPEPGSFMTVNDLGVPILATRGNDGKFHALINSCSHRGAILETRERGTQQNFGCPFHNWVYAPDGDLIGLPKKDHFGDIDMACRGLTELPSVEHRGMLWVHPDRNATIDVDALFDDELGDEFDSWNLGSYRYLGNDTYDMNCNWKLAMDTFGETYHFPVLHATTLAPNVYGNVQTYDIFGRNHRMLLCRKDFDEMVKLPESEWNVSHGGIPVYWLFPNVQVLPNAYGCTTVRAYPIAGEPGRHVSRISFYVRPDVAVGSEVEEQMRVRMEGFASIIRDEDYLMSESQQTAANAGSQEHVVFGRNEPALHHYHNTYRKVLGMDKLPLLADADV